MKIHFLGAARSVTGSKHLVEVNGKKILLDCGFFQGRRKISFEKNQNLPFNPKDIDAVILSHAHIDHSGALPALVKNGYKGKIFCTPATSDITKLMLLDSAHIQEQDAEYFSRKLSDKALHPIEPLYTQEDAEKTAKHFVEKNLHKKFEVVKDVHCTFYNAGHVLGSEIVFLEINDNGDKKTLAFTGDLGRKNRSILKDPEYIKKADILITESTYGGRLHPDNLENRKKLADIVNQTAKKGGKLIIPSFSLERTQEIIFDLNLLRLKNQIHKIDIYIDSPLSTKVTEVFKKHIECFDAETKKEFLDKGKNPFDNVIFTQSVEESKALNSRTGPFIIISASGMCEAGRIRHHLRNNISDPKNTILIVGFQAEHTLGRRIVEKRPLVKIFDQMYSIRADVQVLNGFSGHADKEDLIEFISKIENLKKIFIVHGDVNQSFELVKALRCLYRDFEIDVPEEGDIIEA